MRHFTNKHFQNTKVSSNSFMKSSQVNRVIKLMDRTHHQQIVQNQKIRQSLKQTERKQTISATLSRYWRNMEIYIILKLDQSPVLL